MIVYNISIKIDPHIEEEWVEWHKKEYAPAILKTGIPADHKFFRLLEQDETEGIIYVDQYFFPSKDQYKKYVEVFARVFEEMAFEKWGNQFISFCTVMEVVN